MQANDPLRRAWWVLTPLAIYFALFAIRHAVVADAEQLPVGFAEQPWMYRIHMGLGGLALLLGPFQFLPALLKTGRRHLHRTLGKIYVGACLVSALSALPLTWSLTAFGIDAQIAFGLLAVLWFVFTAVAMQRITKRKIVAHRAFMVRSFAMAYAAVTLRLTLIGVAKLDVLSYASTYRLAAWLCWIPNLLIAEWWLRRSKGGPATTERVDGGS